MALKEHLINAVAAAAVLGIGSITFSNSTAVARHDERIRRIESVGEKIDGLRDDLGATREQLQRLDARLEAQEDRP